MPSVRNLRAGTVIRVTEKPTPKMGRLALLASVMPWRSLRPAILTRASRVTSLFVLVASVSACAQTLQEMTPRCSNPASIFPLMTYDEDDRYFSNPDCRFGFIDRLKVIPLRHGNEDYYISFGVFTRDRGFL